MMKKNYAKPEIEIAHFLTENIITTSGEAANSVMGTSVQNSLNNYTGDGVQKASKIYQFNW